MKYRTVELLASGDQSDGVGTKIIDINVRDIISRIMIYWQVTMGDSNMDAPAYKDITKIELVNGSDVLHSLDGGLNQALAIYNRKISSMTYKQRLTSNSLATNYAIDFGRFLHDPMLALDPKRFDQLQLKISYNEDLANTSSSANELGVKAEVFDEKEVNPIGFLQAKNIYAITAPSSGYTYVELPRDHVLRKLMIQGYRDAYEPWNVVANARLNEDNDKRVIFDWNIERYYRMMQAVWKQIEEEVIFYVGASSDYVLYVTPTDYYVTLTGTDFGGGAVAWGSTTTNRGGKCTPDGASALLMMGIAKGYLPNHCIEFPFGDPQDLDDWYDLKDVGSLELRLNAGSAGTSGKYAVVVEQLRKY